MSLTGFGLASFLPLALAGLGDLISETLRSALVQHGTPDELCGRVSSLWMVQAMVSPALGNAAVGLLAELTGARAAVVIGGLVCVGAVLAVATASPAHPAIRLPAIRRATLAAPPAESTSSR